MDTTRSVVVVFVVDLMFYVAPSIVCGGSVLVFVFMSFLVLQSS